MLTHWTNYQDYGGEDYREFIYNGDGILVRIKNFHRNSEAEPYYLNGEFLYTQSYDIDGKIVEKTSRTINYTPAGAITFEFFSVVRYFYYCDGLLAETQGWIDDQLCSRTRYYYEQGLNDCYEADPESTLSVSPNPTNGFLRIESDLLLSEDAIWTIYNAAGQLMLQQTQPERLPFLDLNIEQLAPGTYVLTLNAAGQLLSRKISKTP
ncbi:MAG: T9SS type A sorting domain-containing protein [Phaeodactylibacter sp.]|nr:T9SS type A sorting domain-containing protein [Phaeodactylibacter sp.]